jgi:hypothetical protein
MIATFLTLGLNSATSSPSAFAALARTDCVVPNALRITKTRNTDVGVEDEEHEDEEEGEDAADVVIGETLADEGAKHLLE